MKDYYQILGVDRKASDADIKKAYRKLASQHHPDRGGDANTFKQVQEAYDILSDKSKRAEFDSPQGFFTQRGNFDDIINRYFTQHPHARNHMRNTRIMLSISLLDVALGGKRIISLPNTNIPVEIDVPQGVHHGEVIRYPNLAQGQSDLVVEYNVLTHPHWHRDGLDLTCDIELNFWQIIAGTTKIIKDIYGNDISVKIPARSKPGSLLRLKGKGLARPKHNTGDVFVKIKAVLPNVIPDEIVEILTKQGLNK